ncbi:MULTISPECIES: energy transducer TonB [Sphingobacterium]|uniref:energy transducer TonB n=1 Tax=Sphingobacterium TaxID=28453 RepID=UPI00104ADABA|nr:MULTISPECIES: energy transducer TonB [Sphingobacterium]MCW2261016.1 TonB family protein [Sphingobacterium kitahiroshimense]TCR08348.1 TonB family protein [Sphingobacterium sp. JUb78]
MKTFMFIFNTLIGITFCLGQNKVAEPVVGSENFIKAVNERFMLLDSEVNKDISGEIILDLRVNKSGKIDSADIVKDLDSGMALRLLKAVKSSGDWKPAIKDGLTVASWVRLPYKVLNTSASSKSLNGSIAEPVDGMGVLIEKFYKNFQYPDEALKAGISGEYVLSFIVKEDGKVSAVKLKNDPGYGILTNAVRALNRAGKWKPAKENGIPVKSTVILPFTLKLKEFRRHI